MSGSGQVRLALFWAAIGTLASFLAIPYELDLFSTKIHNSHLPLALLFCLQGVQVFLLLLVVVWVGLTAGSRIGLDSPIARAFIYGEPRRAWSRKPLAMASALGVVIGIAMHLGLGGIPRIAAWKGFLVAFYGGVAEELFLRLCAMSLLTWIGWRLCERSQALPRSTVYWAANILAALLFGAGHLPAAASVWTLTPSLVARVILVNAGGGVVYGAIFWRWGIEYAMVSHFLTDVVLHAILVL